MACLNITLHPDSSLSSEETDAPPGVVLGLQRRDQALCGPRDSVRPSQSREGAERTGR